jgi:hypothetical protein
MFGVIRVDGQPMRFLGGPTWLTQTAEQTDVQVQATRTIYEFACKGVRLKVTFTSPLLMDDLEALSRPASYVTFEVAAEGGRARNVQVYFDISGEWAVDQPQQAVTGGRVKHSNLNVMCLKSLEQPVLAKAGDDLRIDWGTLYLGVPKASGWKTQLSQAAYVRDAFIGTGQVGEGDSACLPSPANSWGGPVLGAVWNAGQVGTTKKRSHLVIAYDDEYSIEYFGKPLRAWWRRKEGMTAAIMLTAAQRDYEPLMKRCVAFDKRLAADARRCGGQRYADLAALAYRQAIAAHKLVAGPKGEAFFFSKENFSNGCICTVDVTYPSSPLFLLYNPDLLKGMMDPIFEYCGKKAWKHPWAAHDLGTYPKANGQVYGRDGVLYHMPVEECADMIILTAAISHVEGHAKYAGKHWTLLTRWAEYLKAKGLDPEDQLCTDDFAGRLARNANLSIKAILALGCYGRLAGMLREKGVAQQYMDLAKGFALSWEAMADDGDHYRLAFDKPGTWSQKYNLVWDRVLGLGLFDPKVARKEVAYYLKRQNRYGVPLDNRQDYTKSDWIIWSATLAERPADFRKMVEAVWLYAHETSSRVALSDWHYTTSGRHRSFVARSVVGGFFMPLLRACLK